jgi:uncharacterized protein
MNDMTEPSPRSLARTQDGITVETDGKSVTVLSEQECIRRLAAHYVGRVGFAETGHPMVLPVNYVLDGRDIIFRSSDGSKLDAARHAQMVAFEIDGSEFIYREGWSVVVVGRLQEVTDPVEVARLAGLRLEPWVPGGNARWLRIHAQEISGRGVRDSTSCDGPAR